ncbi:cytochrome P450 [Auricularia subglabra TFB-10046 SS5]|nr:cytochrome P450 [Auricularia subglabra TFB-10046 SS5]
MPELERIPQPPTIPFLGNILDIDVELPVSSFHLLTKQYGDIFQLYFAGRRRVFVSGHALCQELCDETRFCKSTRGPLDQVRNLTGDALFTAHDGEENWGVAHRILMPAFGPASIRGMFDEMGDILSQLVLKWERFGPEHALDPTDDFTRLAFDTLALCVMSHRLNSFYTDTTPPFVDAMGSFLAECGRRASRPGILQLFARSATAQYAEDQRVMLEIAKKIVDERRAKPNDRRDLLNLMLNGRDPQTGRGLTDKSIFEQMITFLIAGHETSSGMLSFAMYYLLKNPNAYAKLRAEVDTVLGDSPHVRPEHLSRMPYLTAVMREVLRLEPPPVAMIVEPREDTVVGGKYQVYKGEAVVLLQYCVHRDPKVWGDDAELFRPERMMDGKFEALPAKAWIPFGNGARACIGRAFAWQEVQLCLATLFRQFDFTMEDASYALRLKQALAIKPKDFRFFARRREGIAAFAPPAPARKTTLEIRREEKGEAQQKRTVLRVYYGSNTGSCEAFAQRIASGAAGHGFRASIGTLDSVAHGLPADGPVVVVSASFEGEPPDNAAHFFRALVDSGKYSADGVQYAVFGCRHRDWARTYQRVPRAIDAGLASAGGVRLLERGESDAGGESFFEAFEEWEERLWRVLAEKYNVDASGDADGGELQIALAPPTARAVTLRQPDAQLGEVVANRLLTKPGAIHKHHIEIKLPEGMTYHAGDYLAVLPTNPADSVRRALKRLGLSPEQQITITSSSPTTLPTDRPVIVSEVLSGYVEMGQPATRKNIEALLAHAPSGGSTHAALTALLQDYSRAVLEPRVSVLALLETHPDIDLPFPAFLQMLPAMRVRQYSIASSPLWDATRVALTVGAAFQGVASAFLTGLAPGERVPLAVRGGAAAFRLPEDARVPLVLFASGSGIAPMRAFIQERAVQKRAGREVGHVTLFYGCRSPELDYLYADAEMGEWEQEGVVTVRSAFSRAQEKSEGCKYVQDRVYHHKQEIDELYKTGAKVSDPFAFFSLPNHHAVLYMWLIANAVRD